MACRPRSQLVTLINIRLTNLEFNMELNAPISIFDRQKFSESSPLAPFRDDRNTPQAWKKTREMSRQNNSQVDALQLLVAKLSRQRRKPLGGYIPTPPAVEMFPFKIYQINNVSATDAQKKLFSDLGLSIDDVTFQIRDGLIGFRPYINTPITAEIDPLSALVGNNEFEVAVVTTDIDHQSNPLQYNYDDFYYPPQANKGTCLILDDTAATLICGIPAGSPANTPAISVNQIALNQNQVRGVGIAYPNDRAAAFWVEIVDDPLNGICPNLMGQMYCGELAATRANYPFPIGDNIIPLGTVSVNKPASQAGEAVGIQIRQIQTGNLVNRFPPGITNHRGVWTETFDELPPDVLSCMFYPGDIIVDDTVDMPYGTPLLFNMQLVWMYLGTAQQFSVEETPDVPGWMRVGSLIV